MADGATKRDELPTGMAGRRAAVRSLTALAEVLRHDLSDGVYSPHERLVEADLVARYEAPRAAVREVLIQLASEGLVERTPNRGARVRGMSLDEAIEIAEVRRELESLSAAHAAERATPAQRADLLALAEQLRDTAAAGDVGTYLRLNARFHAGIYEAAGHSTARAILEQFRRRPIDRFLPEPFLAVPPTASVEAHLAIARAIAEHDATGAEVAMHEHITALIELLRSYQARIRDANWITTGS